MRFSYYYNERKVQESIRRENRLQRRHEQHRRWQSLTDEEERREISGINLRLIAIIALGVVTTIAILALPTLI